MVLENPSKKNTLTSPHFSELFVGVGETQEFLHLHMCYFKGGSLPASQSASLYQGLRSHHLNYSNSHSSYLACGLTPSESPGLAVIHRHMTND